MLSDAELKNELWGYVQERRRDLKIEDLTIQDLEDWLTALKDCPAGYLCLESWRDEYQWQDKEDHPFQLLALAVSYYRQQSATGKPFTALALACWKFSRRGDDIDKAIETKELVRFLDFEGVRGWFSRRGLSGLNISVDPSRDPLSLWRDLLDQPEVVRGTNMIRSFEGWIQGRAMIDVFSSLASWSEGLGLTGAALAERVRDALGLPHLAGKEVLEIRISEEIVRGSGVLKKPTFADAGGYPPFLPSRKDDCFGYARDIGADDLKARGGPEVWHARLQADQISGLRLLGRAPVELRVQLWRDTKEWLDQRAGA